MTDIKRIEIKSGPLQIGDTLTMHDGSSAIANGRTVALWGTVDKWVCGGKSKVERDLRPLAKGEVIREGDVCTSLRDGNWNSVIPSIGKIQGWNSTQYYRPVRMQSPGWRYLDEGECTYWTERKNTISAKWYRWVPEEDFDVEADEVERYRVQWPPREDPSELTDNAAKPFAVAETCVGTLPEEEGRELERVVRDQQPEPPRYCVYCTEPDDATMGAAEVGLDRGFVTRPGFMEDYRVGTIIMAHARCAQKASRLQTPEPEPLECQEQWGEEFERW